MKKILVKFSDERNKKYSIRTIIAEDEKTNQRFVIKENVYPEGKEHLDNIVRFSEVLKTAYPEVKICPVQNLDDGGIRFDFIKGISLEERYRQCLMKNRKEDFESLLIDHKKIILGAESNRCDFIVTEDFEKVFGMDNWNGEKSALKISNFDAIPGNIIYQDEIPTFIDYEWVYEVPVPADLVVYHCVREAYAHINDLEEFYPMKDAMNLLGVLTDMELLETAYRNFHTFVISEEDGSSYALCKTLNLKGRKECDEATLKYIEKLEWDIIFFEKNWREACQVASVVNQRIVKLESEESHYKMHVKQLEDAVQEQARQAECYRAAYETVINSRTWRLARKLKRLLGRK